MNIKRKQKLGGISSVVFIVLFIAFMSWYYPFSPFSIHSSFTYHPSWATHNGKTYEEEVNEFKAVYEKDLKKELETELYNPTVNRTQFILPIFEQEWLISMAAQKMDKDKLDRMLFKVEQARNTLLDLVSEGDYSEEEKVYLVDSVKNFLNLEESIRYIRNGKYFSKNELQTLFSNLQGSFWAAFDNYTTVFYDRTLKNAPLQ